jgi:hypothetical protein
MISQGTQGADPVLSRPLFGSRMTDGNEGAAGGDHRPGPLLNSYERAIYLVG